MIPLKSDMDGHFSLIATSTTQSPFHPLMIQMQMILPGRVINLFLYENVAQLKFVCKLLVISFR